MRCANKFDQECCRQFLLPSATAYSYIPGCDDYMALVILAPDLDCSTPCQADAMELCDSGNRLAVYQDITWEAPSLSTCLTNQKSTIQVRSPGGLPQTAVHPSRLELWNSQHMLGPQLTSFYRLTPYLSNKGLAWTPVSIHCRPQAFHENHTPTHSPERL